MTEAEAKGKWCPAYRVATSGGDPSSTFEMDNRPRDGIAPPEGSPEHTPWTPGPNINPYACCIGSLCMAWRWKQEPLPAVVDDAVEGNGYCGLAGSQ